MGDGIFFLALLAKNRADKALNRSQRRLTKITDDLFELVARSPSRAGEVDCLTNRLVVLTDAAKIENSILFHVSKGWCPVVYFAQSVPSFYDEPAGGLAFADLLGNLL